MVTWGIISARWRSSSGELSFYVLRFLLGVAEAGFFPGIILYLTYWYPGGISRAVPRLRSWPPFPSPP